MYLSGTVVKSCWVRWRGGSDQQWSEELKNAIASAIVRIHDMAETT